MDGEVHFNGKNINYIVRGDLMKYEIAPFITHLFTGTFWFLDAISHLYKRVCPSVRPSVRRSVTHELKSRKIAVFDQNCDRQGSETGKYDYLSYF